MIDIGLKQKQIHSKFRVAEKNKVLDSLGSLDLFTHLNYCMYLWKSDQINLRDILKMKTNEQLILEAANKIFKEKGYDGTTVQDMLEADCLGELKNQNDKVIRL